MHLDDGFIGFLFSATYFQKTSLLLLPSVDSNRGLKLDVLSCVTLLINFELNPIFLSNIFYEETLAWT